MSESYIFEEQERLIPIILLGQHLNVPENDTLLRCMQFLWLEGISYGDFCWNGDCMNCQVSVRTGEKTKNVLACRTQVYENMEIVAVSDEITAACEEQS